MRKRYQYDPNKQMKAVLAKIHARGKEHRRGHTRRSMVKAVLILSEKATCANYPPPEKLDEDLLAAVKKLDAKLRDKILNNFALNMERRVRRKETSRGSPNKHWSDEIITLARLKEECGGEAGGVEILGEDLGYDVAFIFVMNRERLDYKTETRMFDPSQFVGGRINNLPNTFTRKERQAVEREHVVYAQEYFQKAQGHGYGPLWWYARLLFALNNDGRWDAVGAYFESKNRDINVLTDSPTLYDDQRRSFRGWGLHYAEKFHEYLGVPYRDLLWFVGKNERDNEVSQFITKVLKTKQKDDVAAVADYFSRAPISDGYSHGNFKTLDIVDIQLQAGHIDRALQLASMESSHERGRLLIHIADTAEGHFDAAKVKHARAQGHKLLGKKKNAIPLYEELGDEAMEAGNHRAASDHYKDALALNPGWGRALLIRRKLKKLPVGYW
jgi:tetratricopeptide (TPR) repeat protein